MSSIAGPEVPSLGNDAVAVLTAIRDHLDLPLHRERSREDRRKFLDELESRWADVVGMLNDLLAVPVADALEHAAQLRQFAAEDPIRYRTSNHPNRGER